MIHTKLEMNESETDYYWCINESYYLFLLVCSVSIFIFFLGIKEGKKSKERNYKAIKWRATTLANVSY
jgi:hypothetical protein